MHLIYTATQNDASKALAIRHHRLIGRRLGCLYRSLYLLSKRSENEETLLLKIFNRKPTGKTGTQLAALVPTFFT